MRGPKVTVTRSCFDCELCESERFECQGDSGYNVYCLHSGERRHVSTYTWDTPDWCPLLHANDPWKTSSSDEREEPAQVPSDSTTSKDESEGPPAQTREKQAAPGDAQGTNAPTGGAFVLDAAKRFLEAQDACDAEARKERQSQSSVPLVRLISRIAQLRVAVAEAEKNAPTGGALILHDGIERWALVSRAKNTEQWSMDGLICTRKDIAKRYAGAGSRNCPDRDFAIVRIEERVVPESLEVVDGD